MKRDITVVSFRGEIDLVFGLAKLARLLPRIAAVFNLLKIKKKESPELFYRRVFFSVVLLG
jgi:hypothetical protein